MAFYYTIFTYSISSIRIRNFCPFKKRICKEFSSSVYVAVISSVNAPTEIFYVRIIFLNGAYTVFMPATFTHYLIAKKALEKLPQDVHLKIRPYLSLYFFGAQGADFCFFYQMLNTKLPNFGSYLHRKGGYNAFSVLQLFSLRQADFLAYSLGFITHYATDTTFHPYVYSQSGKSPVKHNQVEYALDFYFKQTASPNDAHLKYARAQPTEPQRKNLFFAYAAISAKCGFPPLRYSTFSRAISLFYAYPPITSTLFHKIDPAFVRFIANEDQRAWNPPSTPRIQRNESAKDLFDKAVSTCQALFDNFLRSIAQNTKLSKAVFSKSFLTGI